MPEYLRVRNLVVKRRWTRKTFGPVSFRIEAGKCVALVGPMGSGKTTLIKGLLELLPYRGNVQWHTKPFYIPQLIPKPYPIPEMEKASPGTQRLRLIIEAERSGANIIIADEPWVYMDIIAKEKARDILLEMLSQGKGILIASHDMWEIQRLADEVIFIKNGKAVHRLINPAESGKRLEEIYKEVIGNEVI